jgi:hypothetical protein
MIGDIVGVCAMIYGFMIPLGIAYVYLRTDYSKVQGSVMVKVESTIILGLIWPYVILFVIKQHIERKESRGDRNV